MKRLRLLRSGRREHRAVVNALAVAALAFFWEVSAWIAASRGSQKALLDPTWQTIVGKSLPSFAVYSSGQVQGSQRAWGTALSVLASNAGQTALRVLIALVIAAVSGVSVGFLIGTVRTARGIFYPVFRLLRNVPLLALIPLFLIWFGTGETGIITFIAFGLCVIYLTATIEALANVDRVRIAFARTLGASRLQVARDVLLPAITPNILDASRVAVGISFAVGLGGELIAGQNGLGRLLLTSEQILETGRMVIVLVCYAVMTALAAAVVDLVGRRLTRWAESSERSVIGPAPVSARPSSVPIGA